MHKLLEMKNNYLTVLLENAISSVLVFQNCAFLDEFVGEL